MKRYILLIAIMIAGASAEGQTVTNTQRPQEQQQPKATLKGGLGPAYVEHHTVTRTRWHVKGGVRYREVDPNVQNKNNKSKPEGTNAPANSTNNTERR